MDAEIRYRRLSEASQDGILGLDPQTGAITDANPRLQEMLDYPPAELLGKSLWDLCLANDVEMCKSRFEELVAKRYIRCDDLPLTTRSGLTVQVEMVGNVYGRQNDKVIRCSVRDLRPRKDAELSDQGLRQAQKMEAVGQLAGGLAHDFNNLLGVILGYCEILEEQAELPGPTRKMILEIHNAGTSAKNLTQRLLAFSRRQVLQPVALDLNETVRRMQTMLDRLIGDDVALSSALCPGLGTINADPSQVEQVLMNLVINARDAMPKGGKISIATANVEIDEVHARQSPFTGPGQYVRLTVSDTGTGMDAETQSHIFEPFFSTKAPGRGTGLGLSTVFGIVKQSGGAIAVYSEPSHGTTFKIYFHRHDQSPLAVQPGADEPVRGGTETILLVDDAAALRRLTRRLLQDCGYTVLESGDPADALRIAAEYPGPLPLMITDVVMPGFSGSVLAEKLAATRPETKVLYASGYSDETVVPSPMPGQHCAFLEKPFSREDLLRKVRELLDSPPPTNLSSRAADLRVAS